MFPEKNVHDRQDSDSEKSIKNFSDLVKSQTKRHSSSDTDNLEDKIIPGTYQLTTAAKLQTPTRLKYINKSMNISRNSSIKSL